jgi:hypothetical protein
MIRDRLHAALDACLDGHPAVPPKAATRAMLALFWVSAALAVARGTRRFRLGFVDWSLR